MRNYTTQSIVSFQQVAPYWRGNFVEDYSVGIQNLQNLQHIDVLVQNILSDHSGNQKALPDSFVKSVSQIIQHTSFVYCLLQFKDKLVALREGKNDVDDFPNTELREKEVNIVAILLLASFELLDVLCLHIERKGFCKALFNHHFKTVMEILKVNLAFS